MKKKINVPTSYPEIIADVLSNMSADASLRQVYAKIYNVVHGSGLDGKAIAEASILATEDFIIECNGPEDGIWEIENMFGSAIARHTESF